MSADNIAEAGRLVATAVEIQLGVGTESGTLEDAERFLLRALELHPNSFDALEELAHFYDAVTPVPEKARAFAQVCREMALRLAADMDAIIQGSN